ncbi:MAG TPA: hypothetical protein VMG32_05650 [Anaeromyxobacteraceae bacterium]|nr:hypothetical protein [Anaeromyxobacteraceae bacterium]
MAEQPPPARLLISVLFSSLPLTGALAATLHQAALDLYTRDAGVTPVAGDVVSGRVLNLRKDMLLGTIGGPAFEAELETARGPGKVRFLLTRQGLDLMQERAPAQAKPTYLN